MSFDLINNITRKPWAIDPQYVEGVTPFLVALLDHKYVPWDKVRSEAPYAVDARSSSSRSGISSATPGSIAVIAMSGPLLKNDQFCGPVGTATIGQWVKEADANVNIDGIILHIDSPGGTVDGTEDLARVIKGTKKPIVAYVDGMAASAAYWIGSSADEVIANGKTSVVGSIGAMIKMADMQPVLEKAGVKFHEVYASLSTDKNKNYREAVKDGNYTGLINDVLDPLNSMFHSAVRSNRKAKLSEDENVFSGKTYFAADAKKHGLIDKIGSMDDAMKSVRNLVHTKNTTRMSTAAKYPAFNAFLGFNDGFEATEEGIHLQEQHVEKINTALSTHTQLQTDYTALQTTAAADAKLVRELTTQMLALNTDRDAWKAKAEKLGQQSSGSGSTLIVGTDDTTNTTAKAKVPSYLDDNNPLNQEADRRIRRTA